MLTVRKLLRELDLELRSGEERIDEGVRWVHISELRDPTRWLSGGEILLTTGLQLDTPARQRAFVTVLADHELAGLGVGTGFAHDSVPEPMLATARERDFPIFEVPYEVPFIAVTEAAFSQLVNEQHAVLRRSIDAHERLERIVLAEAGLEAVVEALGSLIAGAIAVFDPRGRLLVRRRGAGELDDAAVAALSEEVDGRGRRGERRSFAPDLPEVSGRALALPVGATGAPEGRTGDAGPVPQAWLVAVKQTGGLTELDRLTLRHAVTIVALELLRGRVAEDTERRLAGDILSAVASGELAGGELARRLEPFGLADKVGALVVAGLPTGRGGLAAGERALAAALRDEAVGGLVARAGQRVCALLPGLPDDELFALAERIRDRASSELGMPLSAGAGRPVPGGAARRTFHEARCALETHALGAPLPGGNGGNGATPAPARVATYHDLGSFRLLLSLQEDDALRLFCDSVLGPIEEGEGAYGGELVRSLEAFIEENGQWERAARRLYCHRHTLRYRIKRVEELTGRDLSTARDRIEFWLALRGRELVR